MLGKGLHFQNNHSLHLWIDFFIYILHKTEDNMLHTFFRMASYITFVAINQEKHIELTLHKKWSFSLQISSVNVTKPVVTCGLGLIYWRNP